MTHSHLAQEVRRFKDDVDERLQVLLKDGPAARCTSEKQVLLRQEMISALKAVDDRFLQQMQFHEGFSLLAFEKELKKGRNGRFDFGIAWWLQKIGHRMDIFDSYDSSIAW